ncbi:hypothetical protein [Phocaeicola sp.]
MQRVIRQSELDWKNWLFVIAVNIIPFLSTTGLLPSSIRMLGSNVLAIVLLIPLLLSIKRWPKVKQLYFFLSVVTLIYVIYKFVTSCFVLGFYEAFTNFRYNFLGIISFFMALIYVHTLSKERLVKVLRLIVVLTLIEAALFIAHAVGILNLYTGLVTTMAESSIKVTRIYMGYPPMLITVYAILVMLYVLTRRRNYLYMAAVLLITVFVSYTRSNLGEILIITFLLLLLAAVKSFLKLTFLFKLLIAGLAFLTFIYILFPSSFSFWERRINTTRNEIRDEEGTYAFRDKLIEIAFYQISVEQCEWQGLGYQRDSRKGEYSFVQGGDTLIPPIIYCEGWLGMILRVSIVIAVFIVGIKMFFRGRTKVFIAISCVIFAILVAQCINYMQTVVYVKYLNILLPLIMLIRLYKIENYERNYSINQNGYDSHWS